MCNNWATNYMKKRLVLSFMVIAIMTFLASCVKEEIKPEPVYNPMDYVSVNAVEYQYHGNVAERIRCSISNQSNRTLYYCKFRVTLCLENGTEYFSQIYETGSKDDMTVWSLSPGDINYTQYYNVHLVIDGNGHVKGDIIDAKFY